MPVPEQLRQEQIERAYKDLNEKITEQHGPGMGRWKTWGWIKNRANRFAALPKETQARQTLKVLATYTVNLIPVVGKYLETAAASVIGVGHKSYLLKNMRKGSSESQLTFRGQYTVEKGAQALVDAVRKVNDAYADTAKKYKALQSTQNCEAYLAFMEASLYYQFRTERLRYYLGLMQEYINLVESKMQAAEPTWVELDNKTKEAGMELLNDFWAHRKNCKEICMYKDEWLKYLEISGPYNVVPGGATRGPQITSTPAVQYHGNQVIQPNQAPGARPPIPPRPPNWPPKV